ncbi:Cytokinin dehydrogenase 3 [Striga hermonthica]|uniref:cytokinin dehydrogenase n=1 Tax=Striga hermonthica TaxID=68872 RepID=A0A9N7MRZ1_STRHE|nr:Cytokinin dehydrogenase 3 [Striga hermonthica]
MASPPSISIPLSLLVIIAICIDPSTSAWNIVANRFHYDNVSLEKASKDYGNIVHLRPSFVFDPKRVSEIQNLIMHKYKNYGTEPNKTFAIRARGHSTRGQSQVYSGIVVNMTALNKTDGSRISIGKKNNLGYYVDVGCEQQWLDVLRATLKVNLTPVSWTDYLRVSVCGSLSNAGVSGQSFQHGPQISNVYSVYAITGKGDHKYCNPNWNSDLFYALLGGLGQFGIMTKARIRLEKAPTRAITTRLLYTHFSHFSNDQEFLISTNLPNYTEGYIIVNNIIPSGWITYNSSITLSDVDALLKKYIVLYAIEFSMYYDHQTVNTVYQEFQRLVGKLKYIPKFIFTLDESYFDFLYRVGDLDRADRGSVQAHPWLSLFIPRSQNKKFNKYVLAGLLPTLGQAPTIPLYYPLNATK